MAARPLVVPPLHKGCSRGVTNSFARAAANRESPKFSASLRANDGGEARAPRPATYGRLLTLRTHVRTSASTSGSNSLTSCTVMPGLIRGS